MDGVRHLQVRLTEEEHLRLQQAAGDIPLQRFARTAILSFLNDPTQTERMESDVLQGLTPAQRVIVEKAANILRRGTNKNAMVVLKSVVELAEHPGQP